LEGQLNTDWVGAGWLAGWLEKAPPEVWTKIAVAYHRKGKTEQFERVLKLAVGGRALGAVLVRRHY
jgi:hypothetical protein